MPAHTACNGHYERDAEGTWRYAGSPDAVPGAEDMTLSNLYNLPVYDREVIVPLSLARNEPTLSWALDGDWPPASDHGAARGHDRDPNIPADAVRVPLAVWDEHDRPVGLWAPELTPDALMDTDAVARRLGVSPASVRSYIARGQLRPMGHVGGSPWWTRPVIERWIAARPGRGVGGGRPRREQ